MGDTQGEMREDIPLKTGTRSSSLCCGGDDCFGGSKIISVSFAVLTAIITFALLVQIYYGDYQVVPHGSVATDSRECSEIGTSILKIGGNAVDAAIASAFCLSVVNPHVTGLDAEGQLMVYNHRTRLIPDVVDFRRYLSNESTVSLPRLVIGLAYIHQQYSKLSWKQLIEPSINLATKGFLVSRSLVSAIQAAKAEGLFGNLEPGQMITMGKLAGTLQTIAEIPEEDLYGYVTSENTPLKATALKSVFKDYNIYAPNAPAVGPELLLNLQRLERVNSSLNYLYNAAEVTLGTYRELNISANFHEGTASNVATIDLDDNYVSLVTGMYQLFGSQKLSAEGFLMDERHKSEVPCSRIPLIITDADFICGRRLVLGTNNIATATQVISKLLIGGTNATVSVEAPRYNLFGGNKFGVEDEHKPFFTDEIITHLEEQLGISLMHMKQPYSSCNIVEKVADVLNSHSDSRGGGIASRFR